MRRRLKVATFNAEWMVNLFHRGKPALLTRPASNTPGLGGKPKDPQGVANRIAGVIRDLDADILGICEGPPLQSQMERFVEEKLDGEYAVYSMPDGPQSVHMLVHRRVARLVKVEQLPATDPVFARLRQTRPLHLFGQVKAAKAVRITRLPVILRVTYGKRTTEFLTVHTKSKFSNLKKPIEWKKRLRGAVISAIRARQKLSIEMNVLRKYIANRLWSQKADAVVIMGDLNDGISRDIVDDTYLLHSIVHELRGAFHHEDVALMRHVLSARELQSRKTAWTVEFSDPAREGKRTRVLLDHILYSPRCHAGGTICFVPNSGKVEHEVLSCHRGTGKGRDSRASDHAPLSALFELSA